MKKSLVKNHCELSIERQCELLGLNVSSFYYKPIEKPLAQSKREDDIRAAIDRWHTKMPYLGCRRLVIKLEGEGVKTNRKEVGRFMKEMGIYAIYPRACLETRAMTDNERFFRQTRRNFAFLFQEILTKYGEKSAGIRRWDSFQTRPNKSAGIFSIKTYCHKKAGGIHR